MLKFLTEKLAISSTTNIYVSKISISKKMCCLGEEMHNADDECNQLYHYVNVPPVFIRTSRRHQL